METVSASLPVDPRRYFETVAPQRERRAERAPVCLYLEVTNRCNLLCTTCPRTYVELEPPADMSWELFTSIVDQSPGLQRAVLHGVGEPMLVKALPQMVRYLKDRGVYVLFNTNGTLLTERNGRALIDAGLDELRVSLDASNPSSYLAVRGKNYFARILHNVRQFREIQEREGHALPKVSAWLTGLKETIVELPEFVRVAADIGVKEVYLQRLVFFEEDSIGKARPDQALYEQLEIPGERADRAGRGPRGLARPELLGLGRGVRARHEPQARGRRLALVAVPAPLEPDVLHRQRPRAAVLHRAVLAARLRELHPGRRHPAEPARDLERRRLFRIPRRAALHRPPKGLRQLRAALEPVR